MKIDEVMRNRYDDTQKGKLFGAPINTRSRNI
jgi:hypothetical protein